MSTFTQLTTFTVVCCPREGCGTEFAITSRYEHRRRDDHRAFYCPNGHSMSYSESEIEQQLKAEKARAARLERQVANRDEDLRSERAAHKVTEHRRRAAKGQLTKTKRRVANGVCPCCNRSFDDLGRHMAGQHPDYVEVSTS